MVSFLYNQWLPFSDGGLEVDALHIVSPEWIQMKDVVGLAEMAIDISSI